MKKIAGSVLALCLALSMTACSAQSESDTQTSSKIEENNMGEVSSTETNQSEATETTEDNGDGNTAEQNSETPDTDTESVQDEETGSNILVAYFSCTNHTEGIALQIADIIDADTYEIVPEQPYTHDDLNYSDSSTRATVEQNDDSARPAISGSVDNMKDYDIVFVGYPIWWGEAPKIIYTFTESYDFSDKTIVPFCTSGSSGIGSSADNLYSSATGASWFDGTRFDPDTSQGEIEEWISGLGLNISIN